MKVSTKPQSRKKDKILTITHIIMTTLISIMKKPKSFMVLVSFTVESPNLSEKE
jgi:hypothetical protein